MVDYSNSLFDKEDLNQKEGTLGKTAKLKEILHLLAKSKSYDNLFN